MVKAEKAPPPNRKRKDRDVITCDASRCRASNRRGFEWSHRPRRRQRFAAKDDSGTAGGSKNIDSAEPGSRELHRQRGSRRAGQRVHGGEESERGPEAAAPDEESPRSSSDHQAVYGV